MNNDCKIVDLGLIDFEKALEFQRAAFERVAGAGTESCVILCRHSPVITIGRSGGREDILIPDSELAERKVRVFDSDRGGKATYHGPGQLMVYPILNLRIFKKDIYMFLRWIEELALTILGGFNIPAERKKGLTGVWAGDKKIASIGISIKRWVSLHGLSINVKDQDLENFKLIRPCGMDITMTSIESVLGKKVIMEDIREKAISIIGRVL